LKYIIYLVLLLSAIFFFTSTKNTEKLTQVVLSIPDLSPDDINMHLERGFNNLYNIDYIDGSIVNNTIVLRVHEQTFDKTIVENMLHRWGLEVEEYAFISLSSTSSFE
jgi:hypothetical protein